MTTKITERAICVEKNGRQNDCLNPLTFSTCSNDASLHPSCFLRRCLTPKKRPQKFTTFNPETKKKTQNWNMELENHDVVSSSLPFRDPLFSGAILHFLSSPPPTLSQKYHTFQTEAARITALAG